MPSTYTAEQWDSALPALRRTTLGVVEIARLVLVEGERPADVAKKVNVTRQYVGQAVKKVRGIIGESIGPGSTPFVMWVPETLAEQIADLDPAVISQALAALVGPATSVDKPRRKAASATHAGNEAAEQSAKAPKKSQKRDKSEP